MVELSKLNPWLREKLKGLDPRNLRIIVEVDPKHFDEVKLILRRMGLRIVGTSFNRFITVVVPDVATLEAIERIQGVIEIHYDMPKWIKPLPPFPFSLKIRDPLLGEIRVSQVELPGIPSIISPLPVPFRVKRRDVEIIPTSISRSVVVDTDTSLTGRGVKTAVLDTGINPFHPQIFPDFVEMYSTVPEPPLEAQGHGDWCSMTVYGRPFRTRFGVVTGIAPGAEKIHVKCLTTAGFGSTTSVLKAMEIACRKGAKIISMSLGGPQQGPIEHDPEVKVTKMLAEKGVIIAVAAGNDGPNKWTISSPGVSPWVITVGSISIMDEGEVVWFSSRGPQGEWYKDHRSDFEEDYAKYGDMLIKPDVVAPGGGRVHKTDTPDEVLYQGCTGWFDGFYDLAKDGFEGMHGTSQATPHVAGLITLLAEAVPEITVFDVKKMLVEKEKDEAYGWGLIRLSMFR